VTRTGGFLLRFVLFLLCLTAAAVNTGNNLLYLVLSIMVGFGAVAFFAARRSLSRLEASVVLPEEVAAGRPFLLGIETRSGETRLPTGWAEVTVSGFPGSVPAASIPALPPGGRSVLSVEAKANRRGIYTGIGLHLRTSHPFGLFRRGRAVPQAAGSLVVTPRRRRLRSLSFESPQAAGSQPFRRLGDGADLFNIRDYTAQDDARRIDWKASARVDRPMLREFERDQERALEIVLDERADGIRAGEAFEDLVVKAASILDYCAEKGIEGRLVVLDASGSAGRLQGRSAMTYLAAVRARADAPAPLHDIPFVPRIVLSLDETIRTRVHLEPMDDRATARPPGEGAA